MPSRINIGPENGPYVAINESSGNLQLEDNSGNVVAEWDETNAQWDFANNTLNNVDALNSNSVSTEKASIAQVAFPISVETHHILDEPSVSEESFTVVDEDNGPGFILGVGSASFDDRAGANLNTIIDGIESAEWTRTTRDGMFGGAPMRNINRNKFTKGLYWKRSPNRENGALSFIHFSSGPPQSGFTDSFEMEIDRGSIDGANLTGFAMLGKPMPSFPEFQNYRLRADYGGKDDIVDGGEEKTMIHYDDGPGRFEWFAFELKEEVADSGGTSRDYAVKVYFDGEEEPSIDIPFELAYQLTGKAVQDGNPVFGTGWIETEEWDGNREAYSHYLDFSPLGMYPHFESEMELTVTNPGSATGELDWMAQFSEVV